MTNIDMVRIPGKKKGAAVYGLQVNGHAEYAEDGKDIVCAGISTITYSLAEYLAESANVDVTQMDMAPGDVRIACSGSADEAFKMAFLGYAMLQKQYPQNVLLEIDDKCDAICGEL